jgi:hypothetical protein
VAQNGLKHDSTTKVTEPSYRLDALMVGKSLAMLSYVGVDEKDASTRQVSGDSVFGRVTVLLPNHTFDSLTVPGFLNYRSARLP